MKVKIYVNDYSHVVQASSSEWKRCIDRQINDDRVTPHDVTVYLINKGNADISSIFLSRDMTFNGHRPKILLTDREPAIVTEFRREHDPRYGCPGIRAYYTGDVMTVVCDATGHHRRNFHAF